MAALTATSRGNGGVVTATRNTASASDTFTYVANTNQVVELHNLTGGSLTMVIKGSAPSAAYPVPGAGGTTVDLSAGLSVVVAPAASKFVALDSISSYLTGTGVVTLSGASTMTVVVLTN